MSGVGLLLASAAALGAFFVRSEEMTNYACTTTIAASRTTVEAVAEDTATVGRADITCTVVTETIVQDLQTAAVTAMIEYIACHS